MVAGTQNPTGRSRRRARLSVALAIALVAAVPLAGLFGLAWSATQTRHATIHHAEQILAAERSGQGAGALVHDEAVATKHAAENSYRLTLLAVIVLSFGAVAMTMMLTRAIVRPLGRLGRRAERLQQGELDDAGPPRPAPREIAVVEDAFDEAIGMLRRFEEHVDALAAGDLDAASSEPLPGRLGAALEASVARLVEAMREREDLQRRLAHEATHDSLTALPNRVAAVRGLEQMLRGDDDHLKAVAVLFVDLDGFKEVNDQFGHMVGDEMLRVVAARMHAAAAPDVVARLGGDEFVVLLRSETTALAGHRAVQRASAILQTLREPIAVDDLVVRPAGASIGIAVGARHTDTMGELLRSADIALYEAKRSGKGRAAVFDETMARTVAERAEMERDLPSAVAAGELVVLYQPIAGEDGDQLESVAARVQWHHPRRGTLEPGEFLAAAQRAGCLTELDRHVLEHALTDLASWHDEPSLSGTFVTVALSSQQLANAGLVEVVRESLAVAGLHPSRLMLEISEPVLLSELSPTTERLQELRRMGVQIALDSFGARRGQPMSEPLVATALIDWVRGREDTSPLFATV